MVGYDDATTGNEMRRDNAVSSGRYSERSNTKCVGITIETRPDYCLKRHLSDMLAYGCTRLEIGVQSVYEDVARDTNRSETICDITLFDRIILLSLAVFYVTPPLYV